MRTIHAGLNEKSTEENVADDPDSQESAGSSQPQQTLMDRGHVDGGCDEARVARGNNDAGDDANGETTESEESAFSLRADEDEEEVRVA